MDGVMLVISIFFIVFAVFVINYLINDYRTKQQHQSAVEKLPDFTQSSTIKCPHCGKSISIQEHIMINTSSVRYPSIFDGRLFSTSCPICHRGFSNKYPFCVFNSSYAILCLQADASRADLEEAAKSIRHNVTISINQTYRAVRSIPELVEKISIFNRGYDDRIIELLKLLHWTDIYFKNDKARFTLFYFDNRNIVIKYFDGRESKNRTEYFPILKKEYQEQKNILKKVPILPSDCVFDSEWARNIVTNHIFKEFFEKEQKNNIRSSK